MSFKDTATEGVMKRVTAAAMIKAAADAAVDKHQKVYR